MCDGRDALPVAASRMLVAARTGCGRALTSELAGQVIVGLAAGDGHSIVAGPVLLPPRPGAGRVAPAMGDEPRYIGMK